MELLAGRIRSSLAVKIPNGRRIYVSLPFEFQTSNNEAEYEALLVGMCLAKDMEADTIEALRESMLETNQINGFYEV